MERANFFFEIKEGCKVSCGKIFLWSIVAQKGTNILIFYIFEYGAEYGAECRVESSAKEYFINFYVGLLIKLLRLPQCPSTSPSMKLTLLW